MSETIDSVTGVWRADLNALVGTLNPRSYTRRFSLMAINCPSRATLKIYAGYIPTLFGQKVSLANADGRTYTAEGGEKPIVIKAGEAALFVWSGGNVTSSGTASASITSEVV